MIVRRPFRGVNGGMPARLRKREDLADATPERVGRAAHETRAARDDLADRDIAGNPVEAPIVSEFRQGRLSC